MFHQWENTFKEKKATTQHHLESFVLQTVQGHSGAGSLCERALAGDSFLMEICPLARPQACQGMFQKRQQCLRKGAQGGISAGVDEVMSGSGFRGEEEPASWKWLGWLAGFTHCCISYPARLSPLRGSGGLLTGLLLRVRC